MESFEGILKGISDNCLNRNDNQEMVDFIKDEPWDTAEFIIQRLSTQIVCEND